MAEIQIFDISAAVEKNRRAKEETMLFDIVNNQKPKQAVKQVEKEDHSACYMAALLAVPFVVLLLVTLTLVAIR